MKYIDALLISILAVFAPIKATLITTAVLVFVDLVTGIWAAVKRKEPITSSGIRRTVSKMFVYETAIMLAFLTEQYMTDAVPFVKLIAGLVAVVELKSCLENLDSISGTDLLKAVIDKLGSENKKV